MITPLHTWENQSLGKYSLSVIWDQLGANTGLGHPSIWPRSLCSFSSNTMCFSHSGHYINIYWVIATNLNSSFKTVGDPGCWAPVQGDFHTRCAEDVGIRRSLLNIKESPETLMVRRLSFMQVLNLCFFEQHHWGKDRGYHSLILK